MKLSLLFLKCVIILSLVSCKKSNDSINLHFDYYPLEKGTFVEYKVTKIRHDDNATINHDTSVFYLKTVIGDTVIDNQGRVSHKFYRYIFDTNTQKYRMNDLWSVIIDNERIELVEENQRLIKLVFTPSKSKEWDKNAFNDSGEVILYYDKIHTPYTLNNLFFDSTITVEEDLKSNAFHYYKKYEVYAKNIGLIKKHYQDYSNNFNASKPLKGEELFYEIVNYGVE